MDVARKMHEVPHDAVISVGDNFYPDGLTHAGDTQVQESWSDIYTLDKPWYVALGNHDHHGNVTAQQHIPHPSWNMPSAVYSFDIDDHTFVVSDSQKMDGDQLEHLDHLLSSGKENKWLVAHHPIVTAGWHHNVDPDYRSSLAHLCYKHDIVAIISGHDHNMQYLEWHGIRQVVSGAGSSAYHVQRPQEGLLFYDASPGFVNLDLKKRTITFWNTEEATFSVSF